MNSTPTHELYQLDLMLDFLKDELSAKQTQAVEALIDSDDQYALTLQQLDEQLREEGEDVIRQRALAFRQAIDEATLPQAEAKTVRVVPFYQKSWFVAAAAVVLLLAIVGLWPAGPLPTNEMDDLAESYLSSAYVPSGITRKGDNPEVLTEIAQAYANGNSDAVIQEMINLLEADSTDLPVGVRTELILALANYNLRQGHPDLGRTRLEMLPEGANAQQQGQAQWFIALSYLYQKNPEAAQPYLEALANNGPASLQKKSQAVLDKLDG